MILIIFLGVVFFISISYVIYVMGKHALEIHQKFGIKESGELIMFTIFFILMAIAIPLIFFNEVEKSKKIGPDKQQGIRVILQRGY